MAPFRIAPVRISPLRIRTILSLGIGGLVLAATVTVLAIALVSNARNTFELLNERTILVIDLLESEVRSRLDAASDVVDGLTAEVRNGSLKNASPEALQNALAVALATSPDIEVLLYWDRDLVRRLAARDDKGEIVLQGPAPEENAAIRAALTSMPERGRQWGAPVLENGVPYLNFAARIGPNGTDAAYLVAAVSLAEFSSFVDRIGRGQGATAFLLYGKNDILAHPSLVRRTTPLASAQIPIADVGDPVLAHLREGRRIDFLDTARRHFVETLRVDTDGASYLVMYRWIYGYGPQPIAVGAYFPRTQVADALIRLWLSGVAGIGIGIIGVIAAILLGGLVARPIRRLADSASAVARLDLGSIETPRSSPIAEVNEQARAFRLMLDALKVFETYVPRRLVQRLIALGGEQGVGSETRDLTVMFTDIVHFTEISERMGAEDTATFLNRHFGLLAECIDAEEGTIDKFIGDAIMAFWGAPDRMEDHAARAVRAARAIAVTLTADNRRRARKGLKPVRLRIGLHSGPVVVGNIGSPDRVNYTIVGDTVNDAQRLEVLARKFDAGEDVTILLSVETALLAGLGSDDLEEVGRHPLAGGPEEVAICRLRSTRVGEKSPAA